MRKTSAAVSASARPVVARCNSAAAFISPNRSSRLFDSTESVPSPTGTPASRSAPTGATPLASLALEIGQCAAAVPLAASRWMSDGLAHTTWAARVRGPSQPCVSRNSVGDWPY